MVDKGNRLADEAIYTGEDRYEKPKEVFRMLADMIETEARTPPCHVVDVGCATGELIHYLAGRFPDFEFTGIDVVQTLIDRAQEKVSGATFAVGSVLDAAPFAERRYDIAILNGVLGIFDDIAVPVTNLLSCLNEGGTLYISNAFNDDAIDTQMRYRPSDDANGPWQSGWNIHSKATLERLLSESGHQLSWEWESFNMPFALEKRDDPMRAWTMATEDDPFQRVNGACQLLKVSTIQVRLLKIGS